MSKISKHVGDNYGGVAKVFWAFAKDLQDVLIIYGGNSLNVSQATIDTYFNEIELEMQQAEHKEPAGKGQHGKSYGQSVNIRLSKDRQDIRDGLDVIGIRKTVLLIYDHQGLIKLVGTPDQGLDLKDDYKSGKKVTDHNGYRFAFTGGTTKKSILVSITA